MDDSGSWTLKILKKESDKILDNNGLVLHYCQNVDKT